MLWIGRSNKVEAISAARPPDTAPHRGEERPMAEMPAETAKARSVERRPILTATLRIMPNEKIGSGHAISYCGSAWGNRDFDFHAVRSGFNDFRPYRFPEMIGRTGKQSLE